VTNSSSSQHLADTNLSVSVGTDALCARRHRVLRRRRPTSSSRLDCRLTVSVGFIVVPRYPLSVPVDIRCFATVPHCRTSHLSFFHIWYVFFYPCIQHLADTSLSVSVGTDALPPLCARGHQVFCRRCSIVPHCTPLDISFVFFYIWYVIFCSIIQHLADMCISNVLSITALHMLGSGR
jgi:hypothetical protein